MAHEAGAAAESGHELAVLAAIRSSGLAELVEHGSIDERTTFVARRFVPGVDLATYAAGLTSSGDERARAIAGVVARLCEPLATLHEAGFVHADLKAENVIVDASGAPTLTDFGLARVASAERGDAGTAGSWYALAPEVLLGGVATPKSDVFALGMMLARLFVQKHASPAAFYARFPARDALTALEITPESLPDWSRDLVVTMLQREPDQRPSSARSVGAALCARLGLAPVGSAPRPSLEWPWRRGRETFIAEALERLALGTNSFTCEWWVFPVREDVVSAAEDARLAAGLAGAKTASVDLAHLHGASSAELDRGASALNERTRDRVVFCALEEGSSAVRVAEHWTRAARQAFERGEGAPRALIVCATRAPETGEIPAVVLPVRNPSSADVLAYLERAVIEPNAARRQEVANWIHADTDGAAAAIRKRLDLLASRGLLVAGDERPRLRKGELPDRDAVAADERTLEALGLEARLLSGAIAAGNGIVTLEEAPAIAGLDRAEGLRATRELLATPWIRRDARGQVRFGGSERALSLSADDWRGLFGRIAALLEKNGAGEFESLPHAWRASIGKERARVVDLAVAFLRDALERGAVERALDFFARLERAAEKSGSTLEPRIVGEGALAWIAAGSVERALALAATIENDEEAEVRALAARVRGLAALQRAEYDAALAALGEAECLAPNASGVIAIARARVLFDARREAELDEFVEGALAGARTSERERANLRTLWAMSLARRGDIGRARELLVEISRPGTSDPLRDAALALNLSTLERRRGNVGEAIALAQRGAAGYEAIGFLPGIAQARVLLGGLLRDVGRAREAGLLLEHAALVRTRLGDHAGSAAARGMLGLVLADRGHVRAALNELARAVQELKLLARHTDAALLEARIEELRARIGETISPSERSRARAGAKALDADPRALLARARAAWMRRDFEGARGLAARARDLAHGLQQAPIEREAAACLRELECKPRQGVREGTEDERILALLAGGGDVTELRRLAETLAGWGRDDRAARIYFALGARARSSTDRKDDLAAADALFAACSAGLLPREVEALKKTLLCMPDPFPLDFTTLADTPSDDEDFPMDILALLEINRRLVAQEALPDLLGAIVDSALHVTGAERGFVVLEEDGEIVIETAMDSRRGDIAAPEVELSHSIVRQALAGTGVVRFSNAVADPELAGAASVVALDLRSILCAPFDIEPGSRGVVYVDHRLKTGAFDERAERLLGLLADQAALAVRQVRRVAEIKRLNRELEREVVHKESDLRAAREALRAASLVPSAAGLVGESLPMRAVHEWIAKAAPSRLPVLVTGASGTGKELAARALHAQSARSTGPFIAENCAALPASLIEAELFGYKKGAYTGADSDRPGLFERASGGTLFLDEIGELPLELQSKLLRVLETGEVRRLGDSLVRQTDVRLVAATNRNLDLEVRENRFRADLLFRLDALRVEMPSLEQRVDDIPRLVDHFLRLEEAKGGIKRAIAPAVLTRLCARPWPGNVRELANEVARLCVLSGGDITDPGIVRVPERSTAGSALNVSGRTLAELERDAIRAAIAQAGGDKTKAAEMLGISRAKVYQRVKEWREDEAGTTSAS